MDQCWPTSFQTSTFWALQDVCVRSFDPSIKIQDGELKNSIFLPRNCKNKLKKDLSYKILFWTSATKSRTMSLLVIGVMFWLQKLLFPTLLWIIYSNIFHIYKILLSLLHPSWTINTLLAPYFIPPAQKITK